MKTILAIFIVVLILAAGGYFALPHLIERGTAGIKAETGELQQRLERIEGFVKSEEEARRTLRIEPGADAAAVARGVNALAARVSSLDASFRKDTAAMKEQQDKTAEALNRQAALQEKENAELRARLKELASGSLMAKLRGHLLKVKTDLLAKNIGIADSEIELTVALLEKAKGSASPEMLTSLAAAQASLRKARGEIGVDLPAAMKRIDLLWHETGR